MNFFIKVLTLLRVKPTNFRFFSIIANFLPRNQVCTRGGVRLHCNLDQLIERSFFLTGVW